MPCDTFVACMSFSTGCNACRSRSEMEAFRRGADIDEQSVEAGNMNQADNEWEGEDHWIKNEVDLFYLNTASTPIRVTT